MTIALTGQREKILICQHGSHRRSVCMALLSGGLRITDMKIYPKHNVPEDQAGFTAEEIRKGHHWLNADVTCQECGKVQSLAMAGSTDNGKCIKCGGRTA